MGGHNGHAPAWLSGIGPGPADLGDVARGRLVEFLILAAVLGLAAASWPARRAARLDVLTAIVAE
jgi:hypothetical protein